jgi:lysophosphatidic acid acyltransferase/lysophosphatidylinositol acyltransferase
LFPEGTRWTPKKHAICQKIAKEKGYPEYKHMLLPRTKGFTLSMQLMKGKSKKSFLNILSFHKYKILLTDVKKDDNVIG